MNLPKSSIFGLNGSKGYLSANIKFKPFFDKADFLLLKDKIDGAFFFVLAGDI